MTIIFTLIVVFGLYVQYRIEGRWLNLYSILMSPYLFIVALNNYVFSKIGFYKISDDVLVMLLVSFFFFYIGGFPFNKGKHKKELKENESITRLNQYNIKRMTIILYVIAIISITRLFILYRNGAFNAYNIDDSEGVMGTGPVAHLLNLSYVICPIIFLYWTYHKKRLYYLFPIILILISTFSTFIKYNIIGQFVTLYLMVGLYRPKLLKTGTVILVASVIGIFILNYYTTSSIAGFEFQQGFYLNHFWKYVSGSVINDNHIFEGDCKAISIWHTLMRYLFALPNMFLSKVDIKLFPDNGRKNIFYSVSEYGEESNVIDAFGSLYCSTENILDFLVYIIVVLLIGFLAALTWNRLRSNRNKFDIFLVIFLTYFVFFSFFGTFYILSNPWEILVYSAIVPNLFRKKNDSYSV